MIYGYARVSTVDQETALQIDALTAAGAQQICQEKTSSVGKRPELKKLLSQVKKGDVLLVYKLDRLARSLTDLLRIIEHLQAREVGLRSLTEPIETASAVGRLMLQIVGAFAEFERSLIRERSIAGQRAAVERGAVVGRPCVLSKLDQEQVRIRYGTGHYTMAQLAGVYGVGLHVVKRTIYKGRVLLN